MYQLAHECVCVCVRLVWLYSLSLHQLFIRRKRLKGSVGAEGEEDRGSAFNYIIWRCGGKPPPPPSSAVLPWTLQNKQGEGLCA